MVKMLKDFFQEEDGMGTVEIVIIVAVLVGLALIFRKQIYALVDQLFSRIFSDTGTAVSKPGDTYLQEKTLG